MPTYNVSKELDAAANRIAFGDINLLNRNLPAANESPDSRELYAAEIKRVAGVTEENPYLKISEMHLRQARANLERTSKDLKGAGQEHALYDAAARVGDKMILDFEKRSEALPFDYRAEEYGQQSYHNRFTHNLQNKW